MGCAFILSSISDGNATRLDCCRVLKTDVHPVAFIPVSAREGDNIAFASNQMPWYRGMTVLKRLEALESVPVPENLPFRNGKFTYFLSMSNLLYGVDADIKNRSNNYKEEHMRRLAEVAHLMLDAGLILIVSIQELAEDDLNVFRTTLEAEEIIPVWLGQEVTTDLIPALHIRDHGVTDEAILRIKGYLQEQGFIFKAD